MQASEASGALDGCRRRQAALARLGRESLDGTSHAALLEQAARLVATVLSVEHVVLLELGPDGNVMILRAGVGLAPGAVGNARVPLDGRSPIAAAIKARRPLAVDGPIPEILGTLPLLVREEAPRSGLLVAIPGSGRVHGVLGVLSVAARTFAADVGDFLTSVAHVLGASFDRQSAHTKMRAREGRLETLAALIEGSTDLLVLLDSNAAIVAVSPSCQALLGFEPTELVGQSALDLVHPDDVARGLQALAQILDDPGLPMRLAVRVRLSAGGHRPFEVVGRVLPSSAAAPAIVLNARDVSTRAGGATEEAFSEAPSGDETVLVVDDETPVRSLVRRVLERQGYTVLESVGATDALAMAAEHEGPIHLLVSELALPMMGGRELARQLHEGHPRLRRLYLSAHAYGSVVDRGLLAAGARLLQKPFTPLELLHAVRRALDEGA